MPDYAAALPCAHTDPGRVGPSLARAPAGTTAAIPSGAPQRAWHHRPVPRLHVPAEPTPTARRLAAAAAERGHEVRLVRSGADVEPCDGGYVYGGPRFAARVAAVLGTGLLEPVDDWMCRLPQRHLGRRVETCTLGDVHAERLPAFVKQPRDEDLPAQVYARLEDLPSSADVPRSTPVLVSDVVSFAAEYRLLVLDGEVLDGSRYRQGTRAGIAPLGSDPLAADVRTYARDLLDEHATDLPSAVVLDVGRLTGDGDLVVVEANMAWYSDIYACDAGAALDVVRRAAGPAHPLTARDAPFDRSTAGAAPAGR